VGYVIYRYGGLTGLDLERLSHAESPWQRADPDREPGGSTQIRPEWMLEHFRGDLEAQPDEWARLDPAEVADWLAEAASRRQAPARPDDLGVATTGSCLLSRMISGGWRIFLKCWIGGSNWRTRRPDSAG
jgi:hypothetical protein